MKDKVQKLFNINKMSKRGKIITVVVMMLLATVMISAATMFKSEAEDPMVKEAQVWVNKTYGGKPGYEKIAEDGNTGWGTMKALIKALQIQIGATVDGDFGPGTVAKLPKIVENGKPSNVVKILQYGLYCKGYNAGKVDGVYHATTKAAITKLQQDAGYKGSGVVNGAWFKSALSTDAMVLVPGGSAKVRAWQQYLNRNYYKYIGIKPCDGVYSRDTNKALIRALQAEEGFTPEQSTNSFGEGTWNKCPNLAEGDSNKIVVLVKMGLYFNGYFKNGKCDQTYGSDLTSEMSKYQKFMCLPNKNGKADRGTIKSLLTSCGDKTRPGTACDTATKLNKDTIATIKAEGYKYVGRYLTKVPGGLDKDITREEAELIIKEGLKIIPIFQTNGRGNDYFTVKQGNIDAISAITAACKLGIPFGSTIYFGVDYDMLDEDVTNYIIPYFKAINARFNAFGCKYQVGIYGCRNACTRVSKCGLAKYSYVSDMSTGFSGNLGYKMPSNWAFDQIQEYTAGTGAGQIGIDKLVVSGRDKGVSRLNRNQAKVNYEIIAQMTGYYSADPVNLSSGAHEITFEVIKAYGAQDLGITLEYNSEVLTEGKLGKGWSHNFDSRVEEIADNPETEENENAIRVYVTSGSYRDYVLKEGTTNNYVCSVMARQNDLLTKNADGTYVLNCNGETIYTFDREGRLVDEKTKTGFSYNLTYSESEIKVTDALSGRYVTYMLNDKGLISSIKDQENHTCVFTYDDNNCLIQIIDVNGKATRYTYDNDGRILTGVDADGVCFFKNEYDDMGRVVTQYDSKNEKTTFSYNVEAEDGSTVVSVTDMNGNTSVSKFNSKRLLTETVDAKGQVVKYNYDVNGNVISTVDELGHESKQSFDNTNRKVSETNNLGATTNYVYDERGNVTKIVYANGSEESYEYNDKNLMTKLVERNGRVSTFKYDEQGYVIEKNVGNKVYKYIYENGKISTATDPLGNVTKYTYNASGYLISTTTPGGSVTTNTLDNKGNIIGAINGDGVKVGVEYNCRELPTKEVDARGNVTEYVYDGSGNIIKEKYADGTTISNSYDREGNLIKTTDAKGNTITYEYDKVGNVVKEINADGKATTYEYDKAGNVVKETDVNGATIERTYDANGNVLTEKNSEGETTSYKYDIMSQLIQTTNSQGGTTTYEYDKAGNLIKETDPNGNVTSTQYDADGNVIKATDANGNVTSYEYDACQRLVKEVDAAGGETTYTYDKDGNRISSTNAAGATTTYKYNNIGKVVEIIDANGRSTKTEYDANGNVTKTFNAKGDLITETIYDVKNQPIKTIDAEGNAVTVAYDELGNMISSTDANGNVTKYEYDKLNRKVKTVNALNQVSTAEYTVEGNVAKIQGTAGSIKSYNYDKLGRVISESTTSGAQKTYTYDKAGNLAQTTNGRKQAIKYTYDKSDRVQTVTTPEGNTTYTYDKLGNVVSLDDTASGKITREYDKLGRVSSYTNVNKKTVKYTYDKVGNITSITYPDGTNVTYEYDKVGNMISVTDWNNNKTTYTYDENGNITSMTRPDKSVLNKTYDKLERLVAAKDVAGDGTVISSYKYTYDKVGNLIGEISEVENKKYEMVYDNLYRVTKRITKDLKTDATIKEENFTFDSACNITNVKTDSEEVSMAYDANNKLVKLNANEYVYDEDGNMTKGLIGDKETSLTYDSQNRLVAIGDTKYTYDAEGIRTAKNSTKYTYNTVESLSQLLVKEDGDTVTKYVYGAGALISQHTKDEVRVFHYDLRGSTIALTDLSGKITDKYEYDAYGKVTATEGKLESTDFLYNGRDGVMNEENGLYYMRTRYYSPELRRFINADILTGSIDDSDTLNQYAYVEGNPFSMVDPFGMCAEPGSGTKSKSFWGRLGSGIKKVGKGIVNGYDKISAWGHGILDVAGLVPGLGMVPDGVNTIWYLAEFDGANAAFSALALVPLIGDAAGAGKLVGKGVKAVDKMGDAAKVADKVGDAARAADKVGDAARVADSVGDVIKVTNKYSDYVKLAKKATKNPTSKTKTIVLGKYMQDGVSYVKEAEKLGATYFELDNWEKYEKMLGAENMWNINEAFLMQQIKQNKKIVFSHNPYKANGYFAKEVDLLRKQGYHFVRNSSSSSNIMWKAVK